MSASTYDALCSRDEDLRIALAEACWVLAANGQSDLVYGHVSVRSTQRDLFWMKPHRIGLEEVDANDLVLLDFAGIVRWGSRPRHLEYPIHAEVFRRRADVNAVVHTHPCHAVALAARGEHVLPVSHEGACFQPDGVPVFGEFGRLIFTREDGDAVAKTLAGHKALILSNHGIVTVGQSLAEATHAALTLERAAEIQLLAMGGGTGAELLVSSTEDAVSKRDGLWRPEALEAVHAYRVRRLSPAP